MGSPFFILEQHASPSASAEARPQMAQLVRQSFAQPELKDVEATDHGSMDPHGSKKEVRPDIWDILGPLTIGVLKIGSGDGSIFHRKMADHG